MNRVQEMSRDDISETEWQVERLIDLRYARQSSELTLPLSDHIPTASFLSGLTESFHQAHEQTYGYRRDHDAIALVSVRLKVTAAARSVDFRALGTTFTQSSAQASPALVQTRRAYFGPQAGDADARIVGRFDLVGRDMSGPLIVEEFDTTVVVPPEWRAAVDGYGNIVLSR